MEVSFGSWKTIGLASIVVAFCLRKWIRSQLVRVKLGLIRFVMNKTLKELTAPNSQQVCEVRNQNVKYKDSEEVVEYKTFVNAPKTLHNLYLLSLPFAENTFIVYAGKPGKAASRKTFSDVLKQSSVLRYALQNKLKCKRGDRVAILMSNIPEFATCFAATTSLGAIAVTLNAFWAGEMIHYGLIDSGSTVLFADEKRLQRLLITPKGSTTTLLEDLVQKGLRVVLIGGSANSIFSETKNVFDFEKLLDEEENSNPKATDFESDWETLSKVETDDDAVIMYTSGTTSGKPKGVVLTHRAMVQTTYCYVLFYELLKKLRGPSKIQRSDLITSPLFHSASLCSAFLFAFTRGNKLVFMPRWDPETAVRVFMEEKITYCGLMPTMLSDLLACPSFQKNKNEFCLTNIGTGGAHCPSGLIKKTALFLKKTSQGSGWGLTESNSIGTAIGGPEYIHNPLSCGRPHFLNEVKLVDPENGKEILEVDKPGELWIKSVTRMRCYWNRPEATKEVLAHDGWLRSGDIGKRDANGLYYIVDRIKDLIIRGGENISCAEIEDILYTFSTDVREACVFGLSDERLGEQVCAVLYFEKDHGAKPKDVKSFVASKLAKHKVPNQVFFTNQPLPRGGTGKILKREISAKYKSYST